MGMAGIREELMKAAFKRAWKQGPKMFRQETVYSYKPLKDLRFDKSRTFEGGGGMGSKGEPGGIFFAEHPLDIQPLLLGMARNRKRVMGDLKWFRKELFDVLKWSSLRTSPFNVAAAPLPKSRMKEFTAEEWIEKGYDKKPLKELTKELSEKYDFVKFPDVAAGHPEMNQWVQLNPKKSLVRLNTGDKLSERTYKVLGAAGLAAGVGASLFGPDEAEASPIGTISKVTAKTLKKGLSSASEKLVGMKIKGKIVKEVRGGRNTNWRDVIFTDGTSLPMTKDYIHEAVKYNQTKIRMMDFPESPEGKLTTSLKSLKHTLLYHDSMVAPAANQIPIGGIPGIREKVSKKMLGELGVDKDTHVLCKMMKSDAMKILPNKSFGNKKYIFFTFRKDAAKYLEEMGILEVIK